ncbi:hypothetical protein DFH06DRAFT_1396628 [Mycena polygramma]|nr:hypothetical protein DFH06DRAFT_1396628 [Mycena polygramma]
MSVEERYVFIEEMRVRLPPEAYRPALTFLHATPKTVEKFQLEAGSLVQRPSRSHNQQRPPNPAVSPISPLTNPPAPALVVASSKPSGQAHADWELTLTQDLTLTQTTSANVDYGSPSYMWLICVLMFLAEAWNLGRATKVPRVPELGDEGSTPSRGIGRATANRPDHMHVSPLTNNSALALNPSLVGIVRALLNEHLGFIVEMRGSTPFGGIEENTVTGNRSNHVSPLTPNPTRNSDRLPQVSPHR